MPPPIEPPIDPMHGLILAAFEAKESGDSGKLDLLGKLAENPALAHEIVREAEQIAMMRDPDGDERGDAGKPATFLG